MKQKSLEDSLTSLRRMMWAALAMPGALVGTLTALWVALDWMDARPVLSRELRPIATALAEVQRNQALQRWQMLNMRRIANGSLSTEDLIEYCAISQSLKVSGVGCAA